MVLREEGALPEDVQVRGDDAAGLQTGAGEGTPLWLLRKAAQGRGVALRRRPDSARLDAGQTCGID